MIYKKVICDTFIVRNATLDDATGMEYVQAQCFPTLHETELMNRAHFANHVKVFPEGQLVVEKDGLVIGSASTFRCDFPEHEHTFLESCDNLWITNAHKPNGDWMYGFDMGVLPEYRGLGLSKEMYKARHEICKKLGIKAQIIAGMTIGYGAVKDKMTIHEYCKRLEKNEFTDPTITPQLKAGFRWIKAVYDYINDPESGNASILMYYPVDENYYI
ncbi:GNAT family N-acetyltransferase [Flavobacterium sp.]|uniref:GNAT family N-acetyltransferase n=1 Tax=Flavobacterium sp. TaxID=239 RepID=UPI00286B3FE2|nr:GNAT family N-acetyltransferase [Flavobacterium sp.]